MTRWATIALLLALSGCYECEQKHDTDKRMKLLDQCFKTVPDKADNKLNACWSMAESDSRVGTCR